MNFRSRRLAAVSAAATVAALAAVPQPASAASHRSCTIVKHGNVKDVVKQGTATGAVLGADGVKVSTGKDSDNDKVSWKTEIKPVLASTVNELNYETVKLDTPGPNVNDAALPSYHIYVKTPKGTGTLVYEPYWHLIKMGVANSNPQRGLRTEWDVTSGPLWTTSTAIEGMTPAGGGPATLTLAEIAAKNPKMTVTGIGFGLGTYNRGTVAVLDEQRIATKNTCSEHQWSTGFSNGSWWPGWLYHGR